MPRRSTLILAAALCLTVPATAASAANGTDQADQTDKASRGPMLEPPSADHINPNRFGENPDDVAFGAFQRGLYLTAFNLAMPRAKDGDKAAQTLVAEIYARGLGVPVNDKEAAHWYGLAAAQGVPEAEFRYALYLLDGRVVEKNKEKAERMMKSAAESGNPQAQFNYAQLLVANLPGKGGLDAAFPWYQKAADAGIADAQYALSQIYANGTFTIVADDQKARVWLEKAARQNFDTAELDLGTWLVDGRGGPRDPKRGFAWLMRAARAGNVAAAARIAKLYRNGVGVDADPVTAAAWYIVAHRAGLTDPDLDVFMDGLTDEQVHQAIEKANRLR